MSEKEIRPFGFENIFSCIFAQPYVFQDVGLCLHGTISGSMVSVQLCDCIPGRARNFVQGVLFNTKYFCCSYQHKLQPDPVRVSSRESCQEVLGVPEFGVQLALQEEGLQLQVKAKVKTQVQLLWLYLSTTNTAFCLSLQVQDRLWLQQPPSAQPFWSWSVVVRQPPLCLVGVTVCVVSLANKTVESPTCAAESLKKHLTGEGKHWWCRLWRGPVAVPAAVLASRSAKTSSLHVLLDT